MEDGRTKVRKKQYGRKGKGRVDKKNVEMEGGRKKKRRKGGSRMEVGSGEGA